MARGLKVLNFLNNWNMSAQMNDATDINPFEYSYFCILNTNISFWLDRIKPLRSDNNMWFTWQVQQWSVTTKEVCYNESSQHMRSQQPEEKLFMTTCSGLSPVRSTVDRRRYLLDGFSEWQLDTKCESLDKFNFPMEKHLVVWEWQEMGQFTRVWKKPT